MVTLVSTVTGTVSVPFGFLPLPSVVTKTETMKPKCTGVAGSAVNCVGEDPVFSSLVFYKPKEISKEPPKEIAKGDAGKGDGKGSKIEGCKNYKTVGGEVRCGDVSFENDMIVPSFDKGT